MHASARRGGRGAANTWSPSPHRGEGRGVGVRPGVIAENSRDLAGLPQTHGLTLPENLATPRAVYEQRGRLDGAISIFYHL